MRQPAPVANTTTYTYDPAYFLSTNTPATITTPGGQETHLTYDHAGGITSVTDADGNTTHLAYDTDGHLVRTAYPDGTAATTGYDDDGNSPAAALIQQGCTPFCAGLTGGLRNRQAPARRCR